jgi:ubiquinone/menaquinone biosynthesis C-methylase UbiE
MRKIETTFQSQERWNLQGKAALATLENTPKAFIVNTNKISQVQSAMIAAMPSIKGALILEMGSGRGEFSVVLAKLGGVVTGIDIGEDLVSLSRKIAQMNNVECEFIVGDVARLQLDDGKFDFVVGNGILHHLPKSAVVDTLGEAYRVLRTRGCALFSEPIENSKAFDFLQNLFPVGSPNAPDHRPSILQRKKWLTYLKQADDRNLSDTELMRAGACFADIKFVAYYGFLARLAGFFPNPKMTRLLDYCDSLLTHQYSPIKRLSQMVLVIYRK